MNGQGMLPDWTENAPDSSSDSCLSMLSSMLSEGSPPDPAVDHRYGNGAQNVQMQAGYQQQPHMMSAWYNQSRKPVHVNSNDSSCPQPEHTELSRLLDTTISQSRKQQFSGPPSQFPYSSLDELSAAAKQFGSPLQPNDRPVEPPACKKAKVAGDNNENCCDANIVSLKNPEETSRLCFEILQRCAQMFTHFVHYRNLTRYDRGRLVAHSWVPLFLLAACEEALDLQLETKNFCSEKHTDKSRCVKEKMCGNQLARIFAEATSLPTSDNINPLKAALFKLSSLKMTEEEYFYMKIIVMFNPEIMLLRDPEAVHRNRSVAERALREHCAAAGWCHRGDSHRAPRCLSAIPLLYEVRPKLLTELFFRPVLGAGLDMADVVMEMFNSKEEELL